MSKRTIILLFAVLLCCTTIAQQILYVPSASPKAREREQQQIRARIDQHLAYPLHDSTSVYWTEAFDEMLYSGYIPGAADKQVSHAVSKAAAMDYDFQFGLMQLLNAHYPKPFVNGVLHLAKHTLYPKVFAMCIEYLRSENVHPVSSGYLSEVLRMDTLHRHNPILAVLKQRVMQDIISIQDSTRHRLLPVPVADILPGENIIISFQPGSRDYPGLAVVRGGDGKWIRDSSGNIIALPQLARSLSNMPYYITNGNTPQGLYRMNGFAVSRITDIGPTTNIQLMMPFETSPAIFLNDSTVTDTAWTEALYKRLLPLSWKNETAMYESYYASKAGRTEIIAHGSTVNPDYYRGAPYFPFTPTQGCLATKENWGGADGRRISSDQQLLVDALKLTGDGYGYLLVIDIDNVYGPLSLKDITAWTREK